MDAEESKYWTEKMKSVRMFLSGKDEDTYE